MYIFSLQSHLFHELEVEIVHLDHFDPNTFIDHILSVDGAKTRRVSIIHVFTSYFPLFYCPGPLWQVLHPVFRAVQRNRSTTDPRPMASQRIQRDHLVRRPARRLVQRHVERRVRIIQRHIRGRYRCRLDPMPIHIKAVVQTSTTSCRRTCRPYLFRHAVDDNTAPITVLTFPGGRGMGVTTRNERCSLERKKVSSPGNDIDCMFLLRQFVRSRTIFDEYVSYDIRT